MNYTFRFALFLLLLMSANLVSAQDSVATKPIVDVVWLKDGSKLSGTIMKWELARGMELKLITGAIVQIPKEEIVKVYQDLPFSSQSSLAPDYRPRGPKTICLQGRRSIPDFFRVYQFFRTGWCRCTLFDGAQV